MKRKPTDLKEGNLFASLPSEDDEHATGRQCPMHYDASIYKDVLERLSHSSFRSSFHLKQADIDYIDKKGMETIEMHAADFIRNRLAPASIPNDGKQTPMKGHPVFLAQHATACCCRGCLNKWHKIAQGRPLTTEEQRYIIGLIMEWLRRQM